ncbi:hypothetical protein BH23GEM9_BH23GEM9_33710 [soil metagenome]
MRVVSFRPLLAVAAAAGLVTATAACEKPDFDRPSREAQVLQADSLLTPETFDTISWNDDNERAFAGNNVFAARCRSCHGYLGDGITEYAREHNLDVPSLVRSDFPYPDVPALRRIIFTGHPAGMPTWGVSGIPPREIDAAAYYVLHVLRPEVSGNGLREK